MNKWISLLIWILVFQLIGSFFGYLTQANIPTWYVYLNKSSLTPPGFVFGIVWSILYVLLAVLGWLLAKRLNYPLYKKLFYFYSLQMLMNWAWTPLFFQFHWIGFSFIWLSLMLVINGSMILISITRAREIAYLLIPYFIWLLFATYLNGMIWLLN